MSEFRGSNHVAFYPFHIFIWQLRSLRRQQYEKRPKPRITLCLFANAASDDLYEWSLWSLIFVRPCVKRNIFFLSYPLPRPWESANLDPSGFYSLRHDSSLLIVSTFFDLFWIPILDEDRQSNTNARVHFWKVCVL